MKHLPFQIGVLLLTATLVFAQEKQAKVAEKKIVEQKAEKPKADAKQVVEEAVDAAVQVVVAAGENADADGDANVKAWQQQFSTQFRQLLKAELHFVRIVCQPNKEQFQKLSIAGEAAMQGAVKEFVDVQKRIMRGIRAGEQPGYPDPRKLITEGLSKSIKATLSAEQAARYQEELDKRTANRKQVALTNLVAKLDQDLVLTADQRGKLFEKLSASWKDAWGQSLEMLFYGEHYFPSLPDNDVVPILNATQKEVWNGTPKHNNVHWGWNGLAFVQGAVMEDETWTDEPPATSKKAELQPEQKDETK